MSLYKEIKNVPKGNYVQLWGQEFVSGGCVDNIALLSDKDNTIHITLPSDTVVICDQYSEKLYEKAKKELEEFEKSIKAYIEHSNNFMIVISDLVCEWALRKEICSLFYRYTLTAEYDDEWERKAKNLVDLDEVLQYLVDYITDEYDHIADEKLIDSALSKALADGVSHA